MSHKIVYSEQAKQDLEQLTYDLTLFVGMTKALQFIQKILHKISLLEDFAEMGRMRDDGTETREIFVEKYRIVYLIQQNQLLIVTVLHSRMLYPRELAENYN